MFFLGLDFGELKMMFQQEQLSLCSPLSGQGCVIFFLSVSYIKEWGT